MLKIWSATEGYCAATLKGHAGGVFSADMVERGRNVISCGRDGVGILWDVSSQSIISKLISHKTTLNDCFLMKSPFKVGSKRTLGKNCTPKH
jgi:proteasomal ATPase-associated factor 1